MQRFNNDYMEGAHPAILERLMETNMVKTSGYGTDEFCEQAKEKIRKACKCPGADVYFLVGGTQTNSTMIASMLRPYEGVVAADTGHIAVHEAGAVEATGHKVITIPGKDGKLMADRLKAYMEGFYQDPSHAHTTWPGMVYISHPTEYGTLYTKNELEQLREVCQKYQLPLYMDGARLGYGLMAEGTDVTLEVIAENCDAFYIGGTKVGALFGEAVVIPKAESIPHLFTMIKQKGGLLAKGRMLGLQFDVLFTDGLYMELGKHGIDMAMKLKEGIRAKGYTLYMDSMTNQQFVILNASQLKALEQKATFEYWETLTDGRTVIRFVTSWATREEDIDELINILGELNV